MQYKDIHFSVSTGPMMAPDIFKEIDPFIQLLIEYHIFEFPVPAHEIMGFEVANVLDPHDLHHALDGLAMLVSNHFGTPEEARTAMGLCLSWHGPTGSTLQVKTETRDEAAVAFIVELEPPTSH